MAVILTCIILLGLAALLPSLISRRQRTDVSDAWVERLRRRLEEESRAACGIPTGVDSRASAKTTH